MGTKKLYFKLIVTAFVLILLGLAAFPIGEHLAVRSGDPDGLPDMLGFAMLIVFVGLGICIGCAGIASWFFTPQDR